MNQRLFHAAWTGDVDHLLKEVEAKPTMLHAVALEGGENPLHIACLAGHLNFAATVVKLRQQFSRELNQDGFSPLHIAAACGHVEIVKELLKVDPDLCLTEGKDRKIPLHLAVIKGNVEVVRELLLSRVDSIECATAQGETSLHLAVKNNRFKAFQALIQHIKQVNKEDLLNSKDFHGNTILHLAVSRKQYEEDLVPSSVNNSSSATSNTTSTKPHTAGEAVMLTHNPIAFSIFLYANSAGFYMLLHMILVLTAAFPLRMELHILLFTLSLTYCTCMNAIAPHTFVKYGFIAISVILPFGIPITTMLLRNYFNRPRNASANTSQEGV